MRFILLLLVYFRLILVCFDAATFRNIDLEPITYTHKPCGSAPAISLEATNFGSTLRLTIEMEAPKETFSLPLEAPSRGGFSNSPGSVESYSTVARLHVSGRKSREEKWRPAGEYRIPQAALEFGGGYMYRCAE